MLDRVESLSIRSATARAKSTNFQECSVRFWLDSLAVLLGSLCWAADSPIVGCHSGWQFADAARADCRACGCKRRCPDGSTAVGLGRLRRQRGCGEMLLGLTLQASDRRRVRRNASLLSLRKRECRHRGETLGRRRMLTPPVGWGDSSHVCRPPATRGVLSLLLEHGAKSGCGGSFKGSKRTDVGGR